MHSRWLKEKGPPVLDRILINNLKDYEVWCQANKGRCGLKKEHKVYSVNMQAPHKQAKTVSHIVKSLTVKAVKV